MEGHDEWETNSVVSAQSEYSTVSTMSSTQYSEEDVVGRLFSRVRHNRSKDVEQMLDSGVATVELRDQSGMTPLMVAGMVTSSFAVHRCASSVYICPLIPACVV